MTHNKLQKIEMTEEEAAVWFKEFELQLTEALKDTDVKKAYDIIMSEK